MLLIAAAIWGFAFVAQRVGMDYVGPFTFNGVRFALGSLSLIPLMLFLKGDSPPTGVAGDAALTAWRAGVIAGVVLFVAASLQQIGLVYTTAGKAAFVTCLYIVFVPIAGIFMRQRVAINTWLGCLLAVVGLYFLCVRDSFSLAYGDFLELVGAFFWTAHILLIDRFSRQVDTIKLAFFQFVTCSALCLGTALLFETISWNGIIQAGIPILYGGLCSVGVAYTLQVVGQKNSPPTHAAIILSLETVFAVIGGYLLLDEYLDTSGVIGSALMLAGMLLSQLRIPDLRAARKYRDGGT